MHRYTREDLKYCDGFLPVLVRSGFYEVHVTELCDFSGFRVRVYYRTRGDAQERLCFVTVGYDDMYKAMHGDTKSVIDALKRLSAICENMFSDGGLTQEEIRENEERRAEERELAQWRVV